MNQHRHKRHPRINSRNKGASGEREVCKILSGITGVEIKRSLDVRTGGADITCIPGISVEVKRKKEVLPSDMTSFWKQCLSQAETENCKPVLFTKEDRRNWVITVSLGDVIRKSVFIDNSVSEWKSLPIGMDIKAFKIIYGRWQNG